MDVDRGPNGAEQVDRPTSSTKRETTVRLERSPFRVRHSRARPILFVTCQQQVPGVSAKGRACLISAKRSRRHPVLRRRQSDDRGLVFCSLRSDRVVTWGTVLKTGRRASVSWVRIPPRPPLGRAASCGSADKADASKALLALEERRPWTHRGMNECSVQPGNRCGRAIGRAILRK